MRLMLLMMLVCWPALSSAIKCYHGSQAGMQSASSDDNNTIPSTPEPPNLSDLKIVECPEGEKCVRRKASHQFMSFNLHLHLLLLIFTIEQHEGLYSTYRLDEETPSFAIHGVNLARLGSITIYGRNGSDFLIDFTQRDCKNPPESMSRSSQNRTNIIMCLDPFPLSINGGIPEKAVCKEVMPHDANLTQLLYLCSFKVPSTYQLIVKPLVEAVSLDYAISFRVSGWVDGSRQILVAPTDSDIIEVSDLPDDDFWLRPNTIAIIVLNPLAYNNPDGRGVNLAVRSYLVADNETRESYCPRKSTFFIYAGADPGCALNSKHMIYGDEFRAEGIYYTRSSVISVFPRRTDCTLVLGYDALADGLMTGYQYSFSSQMISSYNYLWKFDDPNEFRSDQAVLLKPLTLETRLHWEFGIKFTSLEGVRISVTGWRNTQEMPPCALLPPIVFKQSFDAIPNDSPSFIGSCMQLDWVPSVAEGERFGFSAIITMKRENTTRENCRFSYELTENEPQVILNFMNVLDQTWSLTKSICVFEECSTEGACPLLVEITINCAVEIWDICGSLSMIEVNNEIPQTTDCTYWQDSLNQTINIQCRLIAMDQVFFHGSDSSDRALLMSTAISVKSLQWLKDEGDFYLLVHEHQFLPWVVPSHPRSIWLAISLETPYDWQTLQTFRQGHSHSECEYRLFSGPPDYNSLHPERYLFTIRDDDRFTEQILESELYSILVPAGCSPAIALYQDRNFTRFESKFDADYQKEQEICDGVSIIASHGYQNPFELIYRKTGYILDRTIKCSWFKINVTVEIIDVINGGLRIQAYEGDTRIESDCPLNEGLPINCTYSMITSIQIKWVPSDREMAPGKGCFLRVYVSKSAPAFIGISQWPKDIITSTQSFGSTVKLFLVIHFFCLFAFLRSSTVF